MPNIDRPYRYNIVQTVSITDIMHDVTQSVDIWAEACDLWDSMIACKIAHAQINSLVDTLLADGHFDSAICLSQEMDSHGDYIWRFGNGHHRMVAAILCGLDEIDVVFSADGDYMVQSISSPNEDEWWKEIINHDIVTTDVEYAKMWYESTGREWHWGDENDDE